MKRLIWLLIAAALITLPGKFPTGVVKSQNSTKGSINGVVYARELGNGKTSVLIAIENRCPNNQTCAEQRIDGVSVKIDDKRLQENQLNSTRVGENQTGISEAAKKNLNDWQISAGYQWWVKPTGTGIQQVKNLDFATNWDGKWDYKFETKKNDTYYNFTDRDAATSEYNLYLKLDYNLPLDYVLKEKFKVTATSGKDQLFDDILRPNSLPPAPWDNSATPNCMTPPYSFNPGKTSYGTLNLGEFSKTYQKSYFNEKAFADYGAFNPPVGYGAYLLDSNGGNVRWIPPVELIDSRPSMNAQHFKVDFPQTAQPNDTIVIIGVNVFGEVIFFYHLKEMWVLPGGDLSSCRPGISAVPKYVFAGRRLCVCGCYSREDDLDLDDGETVFTLDGRDIEPYALSPTTASFFVPEELAPGPHRIGYVSPWGDGSVQYLEFTVLKLNGQIDSNALLRGESTQMKLQILGTPESLPLKITNGTPGVITVEGGVIQTAPTSGGNPNQIVRTVTGIKAGNFSIQYEIAEAPCPCLPKIDIPIEVR